MPAAVTVAGVGDVWPVLVAVVALGYLLGVVVALRRASAARAEAVAEVMDQLLESRREAIHHQSRAAWLGHRFDELTTEVETLRSRIEETLPGSPAARETNGAVRAVEGTAPRNGEGADPVTVDLREGSDRLGVWLRPDDLKVIDGIGPKIEVLLNRAGIHTWQQLAERSPDEVAEILVRGGPHLRMHDPSTWPEQAALLARGEWAEFVRRSSRAPTID